MLYMLQTIQVQNTLSVKQAALGGVACYPFRPGEQQQAAWTVVFKVHGAVPHPHALCMLGRLDIACGCDRLAASWLTAAGLRARAAWAQPATCTQTALAPAASVDQAAEAPVSPACCSSGAS